MVHQSSVLVVKTQVLGFTAIVLHGFVNYWVESYGSCFQVTQNVSSVSGPHVGRTAFFSYIVCGQSWNLLIQPFFSPFFMVIYEEVGVFVFNQLTKPGGKRPPERPPWQYLIHRPQDMRCIVAHPGEIVYVPAGWKLDLKFEMKISPNLLLHLDQGSSNGSTNGSLVAKIRPKDLLLSSGVVDVELKTSLLSSCLAEFISQTLFDVTTAILQGFFYPHDIECAVFP